MSSRGRPPSKTRIVHYTYIAEFNETPVERVLDAAKAAGVVTEFDTGRGNLVWFEGPPGAALRDVRSRVLGILGDYALDPRCPACGRLHP